VRWIVIGTLGAVLVSTGAEAVVCVKKRGAIVVREDACKPKETVADGVALGLGGARAYGEVRINASGDYELVAESSKNVVAVTQGGGGNPAACIELAPSIDASTAVVLATPNLRTNDTTEWNTHVMAVKPLGYCGGGSPNVVEVATTLVGSPGAATKRAFMFVVP
jgi:hypothetical protein